jgi:hypothetical protein
MGTSLRTRGGAGDLRSDAILIVREHPDFLGPHPQPLADHEGDVGDQFKRDLRVVGADFLVAFKRQPVQAKGRVVESEKAQDRPVEQGQADGDDQPGENRQRYLTDQRPYPHRS